MRRGPGTGPTLQVAAGRRLFSVMIQIPVSLGELTDRLTILTLKCRHLQGDALQHAQQEQSLLLEVFTPLATRIPEALHQELASINGELWQLEDGVRECERRGDFGSSFVAMARRIYGLNDQRAALKRAISIASGSALIDEKSHGAAAGS